LRYGFGFELELVILAAYFSAAILALKIIGTEIECLRNKKAKKRIFGRTHRDRIQAYPWKPRAVDSRIWFCGDLPNADA
jgi:hypothetical protein